jgi:hypothetical protein
MPAESETGPGVEMAKPLAAPSQAMSDLAELDIFFSVWKEAVGPQLGPASNGTAQWLYDFGTQTKWLTGDSWTWWLDRFHPARHVEIHEAQNFISLVIGMLGDRGNPQGQAVRYARQMVTYLEDSSDGQS